MHIGNQLHSYLVISRGGVLKVVATNWQPGYTPAHKATPNEALEYAIKKREKEIDETYSEILKLKEMLASHEPVKS